MRSAPLNRRSFIAGVGLGTATSWLAGVAALTRVVVQAQPASEIGTLRIALSDFPALQSNLGSIRLGTSPQDGFYPSGLYYPVIINRGKLGEFYAVSARCPHEGCTVGTVNAAAERMVCPCHFSQFEIDGSYIEGPANGPLTRYRTRLVGDVLLVEIPELPFQLTFSRAGVLKDRLAMEFIAFSRIKYEAHHRPSMELPPAPTPFSLAPNTPFNLTEFAGTDDYVTFYVPLRPGNGIYTVAMRTTEV